MKDLLRHRITRSIAPERRPEADRLRKKLASVWEAYKKINEELSAVKNAIIEDAWSDEAVLWRAERRIWRGSHGVEIPYGQMKRRSSDQRLPPYSRNEAGESAFEGFVGGAGEQRNRSV